jgi:hypothetical protein
MSRLFAFRAAAFCAGLLALAQAAPALDDESLGFERTPPRLSFVDGEVSFFRPGAEDWTPARVNLALAAGDELYTGARANLELQIGARAFARAGEDTQLGLSSLEPDYLQIRVTTGHVSLDLRSLKAGQTLELDTPNAAFRIERTGYYRVEVAGERTTFTSRRGGQAALTSASGDTVLIAASEQVIVHGTDAPQIESYAAPELDAWDRWNYARTDDQLDAVSSRYLPPDVYGADDLDQYGDWRLLPSYGAVWVPRHVAIGWVPYSTGRWLYDPWYGWTWLDDAPWGWAPYHYGRWVHVSGFWGWCPGPSVRHAYYAPALVAFYGGGGFNVGITLGQPWVGWVALGFGEPLLPWWGPTHFRHHPHWAGWGGPRFVNRVEVHHHTQIRAQDLRDYQNAREHDAIVSVKREHFGRRSQQGDGRFTRAAPKKLEPLRDFDVAPDATSLVPDLRATRRPPRETWQRSVVATREPRTDRTPTLEAKRAAPATQPRRQPADTASPSSDATAPRAAPPTRVVSPARVDADSRAPKRPPFGRESDALRRMPPPTPRFRDVERSASGEAPSVVREPAGSQPERAAAPSPPERRSASPPRVETRTRSEAPSQRATPSPRTEPRRERASSPELPGEPANRVYREGRRSQGSDSREYERTRRTQPGGESQGERPQRNWGGESDRGERGSSGRR